MLENYWPSASAVNGCIKNEAETADVSVLLAVHQPSPLVQRSATTNIEKAATEQDLLDAFLTDNVPTGALLMPITGPSGVGKSHIIRWLDAQLQRSEKHQDLHIIRIPKSASLRKVVELILEPLKDDARYKKARADVTRATGEVNLQEAVITFRAHLQNALTVRRDAMYLQARENPEKRHLKALIGHAEYLPKMFADGALEQHFVDNVLSRVVSRALRGRTEDQDDDDILPQFVPSDLILPETVPINQASRPVRDYYLRQIANSDEERLQSVVDLLNEAVDPAINNVFSLEQNAGGMTLQDIILAVREILLADGKDLVLLVEDFAALAGIQEVLLNVCIQEGERDGKKVRATMRTAMALTDGYLSFRDTIRTRAQREWVIGGQAQTDDEVKAAVVEMVGAYLNAARWGEVELRHHFDQWSREQSLVDWLPVWRDEDLSDDESEAVAAFGYNEQEASLFPFNQQAIEKLVDRHLGVAGKLVFNPRRVINDVLRNTLLMRPAFEANAFPPPSYEGLVPNANLASWIRQAHQPDLVSRRLGSLLAVWGGNPQDAAAIAHLPPAMFMAFNLPTPKELANIEFVSEPDTANPGNEKSPTDNGPKQPVKRSPTEVQEKPAEDSRITNLRSKLDEWSKGSELLAQNEARGIRNVLLEMLKDATDLRSLRIRGFDLKKMGIDIPNARSNPTSGPILRLCENPSDEHGSVRRGVIAAYRFVELNGKRWTYPEADDDYVASALLIDQLAAQLRPKMIQDAEKQVAGLGQALIIQSRVVGLSPPVKPSGVNGVLAGLFAVPEIREGQSFDENWETVYKAALAPINGTPVRDLLQDELLACSGCFQGNGKIPFAVDIVRLLDAIGSETSNGEPYRGTSNELNSFIAQFSEKRILRQINSVVGKLKEFQTEIADFVDADFDKAGFIDDLEGIVLLLSKTGTTPLDGLSVKDFVRLLVEFKQSAFVDLVTKARTIVEADSDQASKKLNALGSIDLGLIARTMEFLQQVSTLIVASEKMVMREEKDRGQSDPTVLSGELTQMLESIAGSGHGVKEEKS